MRIHLILVLLISGLNSAIIHAQPKAEALQIQADKKFNYYFSNSKKNGKKEQIIHGALYGLVALEKAKNKRQTQKIVPLLSEQLSSIEKAIEQQQMSSKKLSTENDPDAKVQLQMQWLASLKDLNALIDKFSGLSTEHKSKLPSLNLSSLQEQYINAIPVEEEQFASIIQAAAEHHFKTVMDKKESTDWKVHFDRIKILEKVAHYAPSYPGLKPAMNDAVSKGICVLDLAALKNTSGKKLRTPEYGALTVEILKNGVQLSLAEEKKMNKYKYFKFYEKGKTKEPNVRLLTTISEINYDKRDITSKSKSHKEKKDDKEITANSEVFTKTAYISFKGTYSIVDNKTNEILVSSDFYASGNWSRKWAKVSGNKDALSKQVKYLSTLKEEPFPSYEEMIGSTGGGAYGISKAIEGYILEFAETYQ